MFESFQPMRNLTVKGIEIASRTRLKITSISGRSRSRPDPPLQLDDALGRAAQVQVDHVESPHPAQMRAESASVSGFEPKSCAEIGCSSS